MPWGLHLMPTRNTSIHLNSSSQINWWFKNTSCHRSAWQLRSTPPPSRWTLWEPQNLTPKNVHPQSSNETWCFHHLDGRLCAGGSCHCRLRILWPHVPADTRWILIVVWRHQNNGYHTPNPHRSSPNHWINLERVGRSSTWAPESLWCNSMEVRYRYVYIYIHSFFCNIHTDHTWRNVERPCDKWCLGNIIEARLVPTDCTKGLEPMHSWPISSRFLAQGGICGFFFQKVGWLVDEFWPDIWKICLSWKKGATV